VQVLDPLTRDPLGAARGEYGEQAVAAVLLEQPGVRDPGLGEGGFGHLVDPRTQRRTVGVEQPARPWVSRLMMKP